MMSSENHSRVRLLTVSSILIGVVLLLGSVSGFWLNERRALATREMYQAIDSYYLSQAFNVLEAGKEAEHKDLRSPGKSTQHCTAQALNKRMLAAVDNGSIAINKVFRCPSHAQDGVTWDIIFVTTSLGYNGNISAILGIEGGHTLRYVKVLNHQETVGYGERLLNSNSQWLNGLTDRNAGYFDQQVFQDRHTDNEFDALSGATITARAMVNIIVQTFSYEAARTDLLNKNLDK